MAPVPHSIDIAQPHRGGICRAGNVMLCIFFVSECLWVVEMTTLSVLVRCVKGQFFWLREFFVAFIAKRQVLRVVFKCNCGRRLRLVLVILVVFFSIGTQVA